MNPYIADILSQPDALQRALEAFSPHALASLSARLKAGEFDRLLITGMGASFNAAYPALLQLTALPIPVQLVNAAELVHYMPAAVGPRTLLWINSQSGRSAEILHLLEAAQSNPPACIMACYNDADSPLAAAAQLRLPLNAGPETTVSTKTYLNTLAVNMLAAESLLGRQPGNMRDAFYAAAGAIRAYLGDWQAHVEHIDQLLGEFESLFLLGRGASLSTVWNGALINKEAAKCAFEGMHAAEFRHGPLELAQPGLLALVFAGPPATAALNRKLAVDILAHRGRAVWLDTRPDPQLPTLPVPGPGGPARPLGEIIPIQLLTLVMAARKGVQAGHFRLIEKVTTSE